MSDHVAELETAAKIAREAAVLVRSYRGKRLHIESKPGNEPVTEADKAANTLILERLSAAFPKDVVLSEEVPDSGARLGRSRIWMVDPIDGTSDFILGDTGFVVMIGLAIDGRPTVGAVAHPLSEKVYGGIVGPMAAAWTSVGVVKPSLTMPALTGSLRPNISNVAGLGESTDDIDSPARELLTSTMNTFFGPLPEQKTRANATRTTIPHKRNLSAVSTELLLRPVPEELRRPVRETLC